MAAATLPKYERVKRALIREIETGTYGPGAPFPSEHQLLRQFDVSRPTLVRSLQDLVNEGFLIRHRGKGTFVAPRASAGAEASRGAAKLTVFISTTIARFTGGRREVQHRILRGIQDGLAASGGGAISVHQAPPAAIDDATHEFVETHGPGCALIIEPAFNPALWSLLQEKRWRVWAVNEPVADGDCVFIDQEHAGYFATRFLLGEGRRRIALLNGPESAYWGFAARAAGYRRALREAGIEADPALMREADHAIDSEAGRGMLRDVIQSGVHIDGVVGASDLKAIGALGCAQDMGLRVPEDLMIVSIDNTLADQVDPPLPAVAMPFEEMGYQAAIQAMTPRRPQSGPQRVLTRISLQPALVER